MTDTVIAPLSALPLLADLPALAPELVLLVTAVCLMLGDLFYPRERVFQQWLTAAGAAVALALTLSMNFSGGATAFGGVFRADGLAAAFKVVCLAALGLTALMSEAFCRHASMRQGEYYSLMAFSTLGMCVMVSAGDAIVLYLGLELMALPIYALVALRTADPRSSEAAIKYFLMGSFASALLLFGLSILYGLTGQTDIAEMAHRLAVSLSVSDMHTLPAAVVALGLVLAGLGFKVATVPFHVWAPDVYEGAPTTVTAFMSVAAKTASFAVLGRVLLQGLPQLSPLWSDALAGLAVLTMLLGNIAALAQTSLKRMLAYSAIAHAGYALLGLAACTPEGLRATAAYLTIYLCMNIGAFAVIIYLSARSGRGRMGEGPDAGEDLDDYRGLAARSPLLAAVMLVFLFSLTGIPPTAGFMGKFMLFRAAFAAGYQITVVVAVVCSTISAWYYLGVAKRMYMQDSQDDALATSCAITGETGLQAVLAVCLAGAVLWGIFPQSLLFWIDVYF